MTGQAQQLTLAQLKKLRPKRLKATGEFEAVIDSLPVAFQTITLKHDAERKVYSIDARHADNSVTIKEIHIQVPDNVRQGQILDLALQEFTDVEVWYSVKSPTAHYAVSGIGGQLIILTLSAGIIKISGEIVNGVTESDPHGNQHRIKLNFDLTS
ncbi:hypothetical protein [Pseudomonas poae]|uniref:Uncharacterized protein n=1 Tax=Pseudomonas poae TaxID=200451 RepID=A0A2S9ET22_9PSED|nr:hypothetical protein [Pseudomonas poae]PRA32976.1 hypothetical protein CQZ97_03620 [Pseudomonas poae]PRC18871.1 hypothetical protein CQZ99_13060 [Pseudomonas poae]